MSLLRLLTAGESLVGLKQPTSRYRLSEPGALPKFGSERNPLARVPVRTRTQGDPVQVQSQGLMTSEGTKREAVSREPASFARGDAKIQPMPSAVVSAKRQETTPASKSANEGRSKKIIGLRRTFESAGKALKQARTLLPAKIRAGAKEKRSFPAPRPLQGELSLENIKVVRNDLRETDMDWEIVARKAPKKAAQSVASMEQAAPREQIKAPNSAWSRS